MIKVWSMIKRPLQITGLIMWIAVFLFYAVLVSSQEQTQTKYTKTELTMSEHFGLTPAEIRKWEYLKETQQFYGLVESDLSVYEMLALSTDDEQELRRLAVLLAKMNIKIIRKLAHFDQLYQDAVNQLEDTQ